MSDISNYLDALEARIDAINSCALLQEVADAIAAEIQELLAQLQAQAEELALQTIPPVDLATTIAWITAQINATVKPILEMVEEVALVTAKAAAILAKLEDKISTLGCTFEPPVIP